MRDSKLCLDRRYRLYNCYPTMDSFKDILLKVIFSLYLVLQATETINANCSTQPYVNSKGLTCYPCSPGFRVLIECSHNGTTNICAPCADDEYQPNCANSCIKCSTCDQLAHQTISKKCTHEHDTVCTCTEGKYWDTYEKICRSCPPGKHLAKGVNGENEQCVSCKPGTFSNRSSASECQPCRNCTDYKEVCTNTSDAECNQLSTSPKPSTTEKGTNINSECISIRHFYIILGLLLAILIVLVVSVITSLCYNSQKLLECLSRRKTRAENKEPVGEGREFREQQRGLQETANQQNRVSSHPGSSEYHVAGSLQTGENENRIETSPMINADPLNVHSVRPNRD